MSGRMNYSRVSRGTAMQQHAVITRFECGAKTGPKEKLTTRDVPKIRALLRTEMSVSDIADEIGVGLVTLKLFIKRRSICNLNERKKFISLKRSVGEAIE